ncbi:hypothetical protein NDU88_000893 [Pleurodeles waltl]|uniref:Uncharacterized protein n=1 Tax=Pleurodeles waltl TaxID=8319 RepID=A0AAV7R8M6_PLEWA|nr:hypothetical protein NDU88_000893 [Pleurodeles waltl]
MYIHRRVHCMPVRYLYVHPQECTVNQSVICMYFYRSALYAGPLSVCTSTGVHCKPVRYPYVHPQECTVCRPVICMYIHRSAL